MSISIKYCIIIILTYSIKYCIIVVSILLNTKYLNKYFINNEVLFKNNNLLNLTISDIIKSR